jgi:hypothetical protein
MLEAMDEISYLRELVNYDLDYRVNYDSKTRTKRNTDSEHLSSLRIETFDWRISSELKVEVQEYEKITSIRAGPKETESSSYIYCQVVENLNILGDINLEQVVKGILATRDPLLSSSPDCASFV